MSPSESLSRPASCPDLEEIAALVDRRLPREERPRLMAHLADCPDCYEIFAGTARFHLDEEQGVGGKVVPFWRKTYVLIGVAAAAVLAVVVGSFGFRVRMQKPLLQLNLVPASVAASTLDAGFLGPRMRGGPGGGGPDLNEDEKAANERRFQIGVQVVNLQASLAADQADKVRNAIIQLNPLLEEEPFLSADTSSYSIILDKLQKNQPPHEMLPLALEVEGQLIQDFDSFHFDMGRWAEAGLLSATAQDAAFFERRDTEKLTGWLSRRKPSEIEPEALTAVGAIREVLRKSSLDKQDYNELRLHFETILRTYYPRGRSV